MFHNLLFVMSLSGSVVFVLYILMSLLAQKLISLKWKYRILKIAVLFYLIPFSKCKYLVTGMAYRWYPWLPEQDRFLPVRIYTEYAIVINQGMIRLSSKLKFMWLVMLAAVMISFAVLLKHEFQYRKMKHIYFSDDGREETGYRKWMELLTEIKCELKMKSNVKFVCSAYCRAPMASGILHPMIVFPVWGEGQADRERYGYMAKHELVHIMHRDLFVKFMGVLVIAVHWFNPLSYMLFCELTNISEMYCDHVVMEGKNDEERRKYGELILGLAADKNYVEKGKLLTGLAGSRNKKAYRRRILELKANRQGKLILSVLVAGAVSMAGGVTAFAYEEPDKIINNTEYIMEDNVMITMEKMEIQEKEELVSDYFCVDNYGNVYDLCNTDLSDRKICIHNYVSGTFYIHELNDKGGCTMITCEGYICTNCKSVKLEKELYRDTYNPCRH